MQELVVNQANVTVSIPNGLDPHEYFPSPKDIEAINKAELVVQNGLGLEANFQSYMDSARNAGVKFFTASDYITVRFIEDHKEIETHEIEHGHEHEGADPHLWMDPLAMKNIVTALGVVLENDLNLDVSAQATALETRLEELNNQITEILSVIPVGNRLLVTGHESMGYFTERYGFTTIGVIIPSLSSQAAASAADMAALKQVILDNHVKAIFTELGTPSNVAETIGRETGAEVVMLSAAILPEDGSYFTFLTGIANTVAGALQ